MLLKIEQSHRSPQETIPAPTIRAEVRVTVVIRVVIRVMIRVRIKVMIRVRVRVSPLHGVLY